MKLNESNKRKVLSIVKTAVFIALVFTLVITSAGSVNATSPKPTIVLVHGGWDNSTGWNAVVAKLQKSGFDVIAPANPLRSLASDAAYVSSVLDTIEAQSSSSVIPTAVQ